MLEVMIRVGSFEWDTSGLCKWGSKLKVTVGDLPQLLAAFRRAVVSVS